MPNRVQYIPNTLRLMQRAAFFRAGEAPQPTVSPCTEDKNRQVPSFSFMRIFARANVVLFDAIIADVCQERKNCFIDPRRRGCDDCHLLAVWKRSTWTGSDLILAIPIELSVPGSKNRSCNQMLSPRLLANGNSASLTTPNGRIYGAR